MIKIRTVCYILLCLSIPLTWAATQRTIYKTILPSGEVLYSGSFEPGSEEIKVHVTPEELKNPNNAAGSTTPTSSTNVNASNQAPLQYQISFIAPKNQQLYGVGEPDITVHLEISPALHPTDRIQLFIDGKPYGILQSELDYTLSNFERGAHTLQAKVYSEKKSGESKGETGIISINIFKPTVNRPV